MQRHASLRIPCDGVRGVSKLKALTRPLVIDKPCYGAAWVWGPQEALRRSSLGPALLCRSHPYQAEAVKRHPRFTTFEEAIAWHQQVQWDSSHLDPVCVDIDAFSDLCRRHGWTFSVNLWHRACLFACLGVDLPKIIHLITDRNLKFWVKGSITMEKLKYLHDVLGMQRPVLAKVCTTHPRLLEYSLENTIKSRAKFFCEYFQIEPAELGIICSKHPRMLWAHMDLDIQAKIQLLNGVMGDPEDVVSMLRRQPSILAYSEEKLCALVELLELQPGELAQVLRRSPSLLNRDVESLRPQLRTLLHHLRDPDLVSSVVRSYSQALTYSPRTLNSKLAALLQEFGFTPENIANNPSLIGYSTERRIRPRVQRLRELLGAFKEGRPLAKPSAAASREPDTTKPRGPPKKLGPPRSSAGEQSTYGTNGAGSGREEVRRDTWSAGSLEQVGLGRESNAGKMPESGVTGISEDAVVMAYMLAVSDEKFEYILSRYQRRSLQRSGKKAARARPGMKT